MKKTNISLLAITALCSLSFAAFSQRTVASRMLLLQKTPIALALNKQIPLWVTRPATVFVSRQKPGMHPVFLPQWTASELPVFCRVEHQIGRKLPMAFKFRLGSVDYVDWLEYGHGDLQCRPY